MNNYLEAIKNFTETHRKKLIITAKIAAGAIILLVVALLFIYNMPKDTYATVKSCDLFTPSEAQDLLGDKVLSIGSKDPAISDDTSTSRCSYTDSNPDKNKMLVAAVAVRAGLNKKGIEQTKKDFAAKRPKTGIETVKNLGDSAYFNKTLGQLNVLNGREWIIISYGVGASPETNTLEKTMELAKKIVN